MSGFFGGFGQSGSPGHLSGFETGQVAQGLGQSIQAMQNRYTQLGLGSQGATPTSPGGGAGQSTAALMDIGQLPSYTGGMQEQFNALLGELQNSALQNAPAGSGKSSSPASAIGGVTQLAGLAK